MRVPPVILSFVIAASSLITIHIASAEAKEKVPAFWRKTMVDDPSVNKALKSFSQPLPNPAAEAMKNIMLSQLLASECSGASLNKKVEKELRANAHLSSLTGKAWDDAAFIANSQFTYFNFQVMAHLCVGINRLYGLQGVLVRQLMTAGNGEPRRAYDPNNPYLRPKTIKH